MLRTLLSLFLFSSLSAAPISAELAPAQFNPISLLQVSSIPSKEAKIVAPAIDAKAALVMDADTGIILYEKASRTKMPIASLTKIMTASVILDSHELDEVVTIEESYRDVPGVKIGLHQGEKLTVQSLLTGLLVRSGGDAALALAKYHSGSDEKFAEEMNKKSETLHLSDTQFKNPIGLDQDGHYSTAYDLAILTKYAMRDPVFRAIVRLPEAEIISLNGGERHAFKNTNQLLGSYLNVIGVKTGTTDAAGESIINWIKGPQGKNIISVVLDSPDRFQESKSLLDWVLRNYFW